MVKAVMPATTLKPGLQVPQRWMKEGIYFFEEGWYDEPPLPLL